MTESELRTALEEVRAAWPGHSLEIQPEHTLIRQHWIDSEPTVRTSPLLVVIDVAHFTGPNAIADAVAAGKARG